ncbi:MAG: hypothetical protein PVH40_10225 [Gemmatimonadales bacterium]|jgi:hypothetical protein
MRSVMLWTLWGCTLAVTAHSQDPGPQQDTVLATYHETLLALRDSMVPVRSAIGQFRRDLQIAGATTVVNRATRLTRACASFKGWVESARATFRPSAAPSRAAREASTVFLAQTDGLVGSLNTHCLGGLPPDGPGIWSDSLKAWGPFHTSNLQRSLLEYDGAMAAFARGVGIRLEPRHPGRFPG